MTVHGFEATIVDKRPAKFAAPSDTNWFVGGIADRGPVGEPTLLTSISQKESVFGPRTAESALLHDSIETYFRLGGRNVYVLRLVGDDYETATNTLDNASSTGTLKVDALSPGEWGNLISVQAVPVSTNFNLIVKYDGVTVEESPLLATNAEAVAWAASTSNYVQLTDLGEGNPKAQTLTLTGGDDDDAGVDATLIAETLKLFTRDMGGGMVSLPGMTSAGTKEVLLAHAWEMKRNGLLDSQNISAAAKDGGDATTLATPAIALRTKAGARLSGEFWPWAVIPGVAVGTTRTVPYSAVQAGLTAAAAATGSTPGDPIAGRLGEASWVLGLSQIQPTDDECEELSNAGINHARVYGGNVRTWDNRTLANPLTDQNWAQLSQARVVTSVAALAEAVQADYYQRKIDGRGFTLKDYEMELAGRACQPFFLSNDLYGDSAEEAFRVNAGPDVNPEADLAAGKMKAVIELCTSPGADFVSLEIVKVPTGEAL